MATHPGEILLKEFLEPRNLSCNALAASCKVPANRISDIVRGIRSITPDTAMRFAVVFGNTPEFWYVLQSMYELDKERELNWERLQKEVSPLV